MDSINRNQPEDNREDLGGQEAVKRIQEMAEQAENCWFCSAASTAESNGDRPMNIRQVDDPRITVIKVTPSEAITGTPNMGMQWRASKCLSVQCFGKRWTTRSRESWTFNSRILAT